MSTNVRQSANQRYLLAIQAADNTPVAATKLFPMTEFTLSPQAEFSTVRAQGKRIHDHSKPIKEWTTLSGSGKADYNEIAYWLSMMFDYAAPTGTNESTWAIESDMVCRDVSKKASLWRGDSCVRGEYAHDLEIQNLSLEFSRNGVTKSFEAFGKELENGVTQLNLTCTGSPTGGTFTITYNAHATAALDYDCTAAEVEAALVALADFEADDIECVGTDLPAGTITIFVKNNDLLASTAFTLTDSLTGGTDPATAINAPTETELPIMEIEPGHVSIYIADAQADLDTAVALGREMSVTFNYNNKKAPLYVLDATYGNSWKESIETLADISLSFTTVADSVGQGYMETMRDGDTKFLRIEAVGPVIGTDMGGTSTKNYTLSLDLAFKINTAPSFEDMDGAYVNTYGGIIVDDATWGKGYSFSVINAVSAL